MTNNNTSRLLKFISSVEQWVTLSAFIAIAVVMIGDLIGREFFGYSFATSKRVALFLMFYIAFIGIPLATQQQQHLKISSIENFLPKRWTKCLFYLRHLITAGFTLTIMILTARYIFTGIALDERDALIGLPLWYIQFVIFYSFLSVSFRHILYIVTPTLVEQESRDSK